MPEFYKRLLFVVLFSLTLTGLCLGQEGVVQARVLSSPPDAEVYLDVSGRRRYEKYLGRADQSLLIDLESMGDVSGFNIILRRKGYFPKRERIAVGYFSDRDTYPEAGRIRLEPEHWTVRVKETLGSRAGLVALSGVFLLGVVAAAVVLRKRKRKTGPLEDSLIGHKLGDYEVKELIGEGATSKVYRAMTPDKVDVALKVFRPQSALAGEFAERFEREAKLYAKLKHQGIVPLLSWGEDQGIHFLVMEYVDGVSLAELPTRKELELNQVLDILEQAASALSYAHSQGIIHRDVKPENFLVTHSMRIKLLDFGLAREVLSSLTRTGHSLGTPAYMSPEQIQGGFVDHRCDQYSLGGLAYFLLTGKKPFDTEETDSAPILFQQLHGVITPIEELNSSVSVELCALVYRLMEREPSSRFSRMDEVLTELQGIPRA